MASTGTGKRTVGGTKKFSQTAAQRKKESKKEGKRKMRAARETERDTTGRGIEQNLLNKGQ